MIAPPYSTEFVQLFLPIVRNEEITGRLRNADHTDDVSLFLGERRRGDENLISLYNVKTF